MHKWWLKVTYELPKLSYDYIGPFKSRRAAKKHRKEWGPVKADIENQLSVSWDGTWNGDPWTPEKHIEYMKKRY
jgi:hypothetical protein